MSRPTTVHTSTGLINHLASSPGLTTGLDGDATSLSRSPARLRSKVHSSIESARTSCPAPITRRGSCQWRGARRESSRSFARRDSCGRRARGIRPHSYRVISFARWDTEADTRASS
jgi:hypothetical protein